MYLASTWKCLPACVQEAERQRQEDAREDFPANRGWSFIEAAHWIEINPKNPPISARIPYDSIGFHAKNYSMVMLQAGNFPNNSFSLQLWWWVCWCRNTLLRYDPQHLENKKNGCIPSCEGSHIPCSKASSKMMFLFLRWKKWWVPWRGSLGSFWCPGDSERGLKQQCRVATWMNVSSYFFEKRGSD